MVLLANVTCIIKLYLNVIRVSVGMLIFASWVDIKSKFLVLFSEFFVFCWSLAFKNIWSDYFFGVSFSLYDLLNIQLPYVFLVALMCCIYGFRFEMDKVRLCWLHSSNVKMRLCKSLCKIVLLLSVIVPFTGILILSNWLTALLQIVYYLINVANDPYWFEFHTFFIIF